MSEPLKIDEKLVSTLVGKQFPQWKALPIRQVIPGGWDNKTFRLVCEDFQLFFKNFSNQPFVNNEKSFDRANKSHNDVK